MNRSLTVLFASKPKHGKEREKKMLAEEVNFLKDEVDRSEMVQRKDHLKFLGIPESTRES